jgi:hypothetical protein
VFNRERSFPGFVFVFTLSKVNDIAGLTDFFGFLRRQRRLGRKTVRLSVAVRRNE